MKSVLKGIASQPTLIHTCLLKVYGGQDNCWERLCITSCHRDETWVGTILWNNMSWQMRDRKNRNVCTDWRLGGQLVGSGGSKSGEKSRRGSNKCYMTKLWEQLHDSRRPLLGILLHGQYHVLLLPFTAKEAWINSTRILCVLGWIQYRHDSRSYRCLFHAMLLFTNSIMPLKTPLMLNCSLKQGEIITHNNLESF